MRYVAPKSARIELNTEEYEILDNARKLLEEMRKKLLDYGFSSTDEFVVYDECTDIDSTVVTLSDLTQVSDFLHNIV